MASLRLNLLGGFELTRRSGEAVPIAKPRRKAQALLAYLACRPGHAHPRDQLAALLWPDIDAQQARAALRRTLSALRAAVATHLRIDEDRVALDPTDIDIDVARLERLLRAGSPGALEEAGELYRGDLLAGLGVTEAPFEEWLSAERERLREAVLEGLARLLGEQMRASNAAAALVTARRLIALDPLQEVVHRALMRLYAAGGRRDAALRQYQVCVDTLQRELGTEPEADTRRLYQEVLGGREGGGLAALRETLPMPTDPPKRGGLGCARELFVSEIPTVGRDAELVRLGEALEEAFAGRGQTMAILGEAGIGKSRLLSEIGRRARERDGVVLLGRCYPTEMTIAYAPWVEAFRVGGVLADVGVRERLEPTWQAELARLFPELGPAGDAGPARPEDQVRLLDAVTRLMQCLTASGPVALLLEDVHWADELSVQLLSTLARRIARWPTLVVVTAREEELGELPLLRDLLARPDVRRLPLAPLSRPEGAALVKALSGNHLEAAGTAEVADRIWAASAGNPFMMIETVRAIEQRAWVPDDALPLPDQVRALIGARLDRLSPRSRQLTALGAVIGRQFPFELLERAAGTGADDAEAGVEELIRRRVLRVVGEQFELVHDRLRECVYEQLSPIRRKLLHRRVAEALEALHGSDDEPHIPALAEHCRAGEVWGKAATYLRRAGAQAIRQAAVREAVALYEQAMAALAHLPETRATLELAVDLRLDLLGTLLWADLSHMGATLDEAERLALALGDSGRIAWIHVFRSRHLYVSGRSADALRAAQRAVATARSVDDAGLASAAQYALGLASIVTGDYRVARACFTSALRALDGTTNRPDVRTRAVTLVLVRAWLVMIHGVTGEFDAGIRVGTEAIGMVDETAEPGPLSQVCTWLGDIYLHKGDFDSAIRLLERAVSIARRAKLLHHHADELAHLGFAYAETGRTEKARALVEQSRRDAAALGFGAFEAFKIVCLGTAALRAGDPVEARALGERACALARADGERGNEAAALHLIGSAMSALAPAGDHDGVLLDAARRHLVDALALADELGMRPLAARCHLGLGQLYARAGAGERSTNSLTTAAAMFRDMDMTYWREQAESALRKSASSPSSLWRHA
jgi:predicted ATPase/DNA-binding SARP family transcriptional activator